MGARLINNPRQTKIGHVEAFRILSMRSLRKGAMFNEGQRPEGHLEYSGVSVRARERRRSSLERLDDARAAMAQRKDVQPEWVLTTFGTFVDGLKAATTSPDTSPIPPRSASSDPGPQVNIGILQRLGFVQTGKMLGDQLGWSEAWIPEPGRRLFFIIDLRDRRRPCAVLLVCDPGRQAHQLFALKRIIGRFGRQEYCFICPHTGRQSTVIFYSEGQFFCSM